MWLPSNRRFGRMSDMWSEMDRVQREMNRLFSGESVAYAPGYPAINVWSCENDLILTSEIPGVDPDSVDISVEGDMLTISGSRPREELGEDEHYHRQERAHGNFKRKIKLPFRADANNVDATYEKGVLKIMLPRIEEEKPQKILIKTE